MASIDIEQIKEQMASLADTSYVVSERPLVNCFLSLLNFLHKTLYSQLQLYDEENGLNESEKKSEKDGYRKAFITIDQLFNLSTIISEYITKKMGGFYVCFIDFSKAFDSIPHTLLRYQLLGNEFHCKHMRVIQMYSNSKSCVLTREGWTYYFTYVVDISQGCMLRTFVFTLYIGELVVMLMAILSVFISKTMSNVNLLLYADDIALFADTLIRLKNLISFVCFVEGKSRQNKNSGIHKWNKSEKYRKMDEVCN